MIRLEQLRVDALLTPEQLGDEVGLSGGTIRRMEQGHGARVSSLAKLARRFEVPASELLREVDADTKAAA